MGLTENFVDEREEKLARIDDALKDSGRFRLGAFEGPEAGEFGGVDAMIAAVNEKLRDPLKFFGAESEPRSVRLSQNVLEFDSMGLTGSVNDVARATVHVSGRKRRRAAIIVPHWNGREDSYDAMARALSWFGFSTFVLTLPHHHVRSATAERQVANEFLNADLGAAIRSVRQSVCDVRSLVTWLYTEGYAEVHLIGVSLGSCVAALAAAFDPRLISTSLFLTAGDFAETVWNGRATQHIRATLDPCIEFAQLKSIWAIISPSSFLDLFRKNEVRLLMVNGRRDKVVPFHSTVRFVNELRTAGVNVQWRVLPCGHYTLADPPFSWWSLLLAVWFMSRSRKRL
ncbi:MAG TPA: alpha/beta hydrolase family protein [Bradyrhizobium sp.]|nr:alpha/beta hydrolase family protein [Bradyrhizobium sp.]